MILISAQYGALDADTKLNPMHFKLNKVFEKHMQGKYFKTIKEFSIIFRVAGHVLNFGGGDGPERLRYVKKGNYINVDLVIPVWRWSNLTNDDLKKYITLSIGQCFELLLNKAKELNEIVDEESLKTDFLKAMKEFVQNEGVLPPEK